jgi:hypothetical protein
MKWRWEYVAELCNAYDLRNGAELGVKEGRFTTYILENVPGSTMLSVDLWGCSAGSEDYSDWPMEHYYRSFSTAMEKYGPRSKILRMSTIKAAEKIEDGSLDFVFIDADHSYESVKEDIDAWRPKVRKHGMVIGHDLSWLPVEKAVIESFPDYAKGSNNTWSAQI